jgi:hypothetical protein
MTKFIDTPAGRQILKDQFDYEDNHPIFERCRFCEKPFIDPNFLEWLDDFADCFSNYRLSDLEKLHEEWVKGGRWREDDAYFTRVIVKDYLEENSCDANYMKFIECNSHDIDLLPDSLKNAVELDEREYIYTEAYIASLRALVK